VILAVDPSVVRRACVLFVLVLTGCPSSIPAYDYVKEPDPRNHDVVLGVGDVLGINVWGDRDLNSDVTIRPDGSITLPLIGDLKAVGETTATLKAHILERLAQFLKQLQGTEVTVALRNWRSYRFTVAGEVTKQGVFTSDQYVTVADAIAMAGGLTRFAKRGEIQLMRRDPKTGNIRNIPLDYDQLASGKRLDMNIYVLAGDAIFVP
jgi:polysaccharide export outer membrane protein